MPECHSTNSLALELCQQSHAAGGYFGYYGSANCRTGTTRKYVGIASRNEFNFLRDTKTYFSCDKGSIFIEHDH